MYDAIPVSKTITNFPRKSKKSTTLGSTEKVGQNIMDKNQTYQGQPLEPDFSSAG